MRALAPILPFAYARSNHFDREESFDQFLFFFDKVSEAIGRALKTNKSLTHLWLHGNGMGVEGSVNFAKGLAGNHILKRLDISLNHLKDEGTVNIAAALELGAQLESLNLSHNAIGTRGTMRLAQAISSGNLFIRSLDLSTNALGGKAANLLGEV